MDSHLHGAALVSWRLEYRGLEELKTALRALPADLARDAGPIIERHARGAMEATREEYPEETGALKRGLRLSEDVAPSRFGVAYTVRNSAPHSHLYEYGTQTIRLTSTGASRGQMPAQATFVPNMLSYRRRMYGALGDMLTEHGLLVSGSVDAGAG